MQVDTMLDKPTMFNAHDDSPIHICGGKVSL